MRLARNQRSRHFSITQADAACICGGVFALIRRAIDSRNVAGTLMAQTNRPLVSNNDVGKASPVTRLPSGLSKAISSTIELPFLPGDRHRIFHR